MSSVKNRFGSKRLALPLIAAGLLVATEKSSALTEIEFSGWTEVSIENPDFSGEIDDHEFLGTAVLSIYGDFTFDEMAVETSANNFSGAAYNLSLILDLDDWIPDGQSSPPAFFLPYFTDFQNNPEYQNGDIFVGNDGGSEFGVSFPVYNGPALLNEPFDFTLRASSEVFAEGDLKGATNILLNASDPLSLFETTPFDIYYQGPLGDGLEDNLFFEFSQLSVSSVAPVPLPAPLLMMLLPLARLFLKRRTRSL